MSTESARQRLTHAAFSTVALALLAPCVAAASPQEMIERAGPPVPVPRSRPCEVQLFSDATFASEDTNYLFSPPVGCPPPWAKVVLSMDLSGADRARGIAVALEGVTVFLGPTPGTRQPSSWHVERDLTDYSALFKKPGAGTLNAMLPSRSYGNVPTVGSATLRFYPPTATQPAPRVPDAVFSAYTALYPPDLPYGEAEPIKDLSALPHNIERAYLDVTANDDAFWYACITQKLANAHPTLVSNVALGLGDRGVFPVPQGCFPHSYADVGITVDATPAGVAPVFPWLPTDFSINQGPRPGSALWNAVDTPTDSVQSLDYVPYRVDLTPFAAILNEAGSHQVVLNMPRWSNTNLKSYLGPRNANLLVYLDHGKTRLSGAVTYNSLSAAQPQPSVTDDLVQDGDLLQGRVRTRMDRNFEICGYVDTSHGRVHTSVVQQSKFHNVQQFHVKDDASYEYDLPAYREDLWLETSTRSISRRTQGSHLLSEDRQEVSYPLELHYVGIGRLTTWYSDNEHDYDVDLFGGSVSVDQHRLANASHYRHGLEPYRTHLQEEFSGSHRVDPDTGASSHWQAAHTFAFHDNRGSCYQKAVTTRNGVLDDTITGMTCPNGQNHVRWFAHPDGSADGLSWMNP